MQTESNLNVVKTLTEIEDTVSNLLLLLSDKEKKVIVNRFDLEKKGKQTLEEIGQEFGVTRERVRQIERNALAKMKRNVFNTTLRSLHDFISNIIKLHGGIIKEDELFNILASVMPGNSKVDKNPSHLAFVLHDSIDCIGNTILFHPYLKSKDIPEFFMKFSSNKLVNYLQKNGDLVKVDEIFNDLSPSLSEFDLSSTKLRSLITIDKRTTLINGDLVGLKEWRHINPRTLREKILYILRQEEKPMHFNAIAEKISGAKFDQRDVNIQAVHNELIRHDQFVLIGRGIYALSDWGYEKGTVSDVIECILKEKKELNIDEIIDAVLEKRQIKRITIMLALKDSNKFERIGRKRYKLAK
jgi:transcriptional regulator